MAPKAAKGKAVLEPPPQPIIQRPATPNDFQIVATVRTLQGLVNVETKWKNRLQEAQHLSAITAAKMRKLQGMVEKCQEGIEQLAGEVEEIIGAIVLGDLTNPLGPLGAPQPPPVAGAGAKAASRKSQGEVKAVIPMETLPPTALAQRKAEAELLGAILRGFYNLPQLEKEKLLTRTRPPVSTPDAMLHEIEEARRLSTPTAELLAQAQERSMLSPKVTGAASPAKRQSIKPGAGGSKAKEPVIDFHQTAAEETIGGLNPSDFLPLPCPRAVDPRIMNRVLILRSRRIRLEQCIQLFTHEMNPLQHRNEGVADLLSLGNYSLSAVQPRIHNVVEEEAALQRISQQETEAWNQRRAASVPPATPQEGKRR
jgi:hypothetical protein